MKIIKKGLLYIVSLIAGVITLAFTFLILLVALATISVGLPISFIMLMADHLDHWTKKKREEINK